MLCNAKGGMLAGHDEGKGKIVKVEWLIKYIEFYGSQVLMVANKKHYGGLADYRSSEGLGKVRVKYRGKIKRYH